MSTESNSNKASIGCTLSASWTLSTDGKQLKAQVLSGAGKIVEEGTLSASATSLPFTYKAITDEAQGELSVAVANDGRIKTLSAVTNGWLDLAPCFFNSVIAVFTDDAG